MKVKNTMNNPIVRVCTLLTIGIVILSASVLMSCSKNNCNDYNALKVERDKLQTELDYIIDFKTPTTHRSYYKAYGYTNAKKYQLKDLETWSQKLVDNSKILEEARDKCYMGN